MFLTHASHVFTVWINREKFTFFYLPRLRSINFDELQLTHNVTSDVARQTGRQIYSDYLRHLPERCGNFGDCVTAALYFIIPETNFVPHVLRWDIESGIAVLTGIENFIHNLEELQIHILKLNYWSNCNLHFNLNNMSKNNYVKQFLGCFFTPTFLTPPHPLRCLSALACRVVWIIFTHQHSQ